VVTSFKKKIMSLFYFCWANLFVERIQMSRICQIIARACEGDIIWED